MSSDLVSGATSWLGKLLSAIGLRQTSIDNQQSQVVNFPGNLRGNLWKQFTRYDNTHPNMSACGNVHFAPSSHTDYDWGNHRTVLCNADDWLITPISKANCAR